MQEWLGNGVAAAKGEELLLFSSSDSESRERMYREGVRQLSGPRELVKLNSC